MNSDKCRKRQLFNHCTGAIIKLLLAYGFRKIFFIVQDLKHIHLKYFFLELFFAKIYFSEIRSLIDEFLHASFLADASHGIFLVVKFSRMAKF